MPAFAYLIIWRIAPLVYTLFLGFCSWNFVRAASPTFIGLGNYRELFLGRPLYHALKVTLIFAGVAVFLELSIGLGIAVLLDREIRGKSVWRSMLIIPMMLTPAIVGTMWYILLHQTVGPINYFLKAIGLPAPNWLGDRQIALFSIIGVDVWQWTPFIFLLALASLQTIPKDLYDAAKIDGAAGIQIYCYISLPAIKQTLFLAIILRSMDALKVFDKIFVMTKGGPGNATESLSVLIYRAGFLFFRMGYAGAMVIIFLMITSLLYLRIMKLIKV